MVTMANADQSDTFTEDKFPPRPESPLPGDCCGNGCNPCVLDIHRDELEQWRKECQRIELGLPRETHQSHTDENSVTNCISPSEYSSFELSNIQQVTPDSYIYRFSLPNHSSLHLQVGQHLILRGFINNAQVTRQYTPISPLAAVGYFDVLIKLYENGRMSQWIRTWAVGDLVEWRGPFGSFTYTPNTYSHIVMLAAGTGIAPMAQVIRAVLENEDDETFLRLIYACCRQEELLMKTTLDEWTDYWNFTVLYALSQDSPDRPVQRRYGDMIQYGRITEELIEEELKKRSGNTLVLICGTKSFDKDMINFVRRTGVPDKNIFKF